MTDVIAFPSPSVEPDDQLSLEQAIAFVRTRSLEMGVIAYYTEDGNVGIINFGDLSRKDALWLAEQLKRNALGEEIL